jgi:hypothetical protein
VHSAHVRSRGWRQYRTCSGMDLNVQRSSTKARESKAAPSNRKAVVASNRRWRSRITVSLTLTVGEASSEVHLGFSPNGMSLPAVPSPVGGPPFPSREDQAVCVSLTER